MPYGNKAQVFLPKRQNAAARPQQAKQRGGAKQKAQRQRKPGRAEQQREAKVPVFIMCLPPAQADGVLNGAAHADARAPGLQECREGICNVDGGQSLVAQRVAHEKAVCNGIHP